MEKLTTSLAILLIGRKVASPILIHETPFDFDVVPSHNMLESLPKLLTKAEEMAEDLGESFDTNDRLRHVPQRMRTYLTRTIRSSSTRQQQQDHTCTMLCQRRDRSSCPSNQRGREYSQWKDPRHGRKP